MHLNKIKVYFCSLFISLITFKKLILTNFIKLDNWYLGFNSSLNNIKNKKKFVNNKKEEKFVKFVHNV